MRKTIYLPDDLAAQVDEYLKQHDGETFSSLIQRVVQREVAPKDPSALLDLVGLVKSGTPRKVVPVDARQPEDRHTDR